MRPGFDPWVGEMTWRRERLPTPVFWPGEFHGLYSPWGHKGSDMTEQLSLSVSLRVAGGSTAQVDQLCHTGLADPLRREPSQTKDQACVGTDKH